MSSGRLRRMLVYMQSTCRRFNPGHVVHEPCYAPACLEMLSDLHLEPPPDSTAQPLYPFDEQRYKLKAWDRSPCEVLGVAVRGEECPD